MLKHALDSDTLKQNDFTTQLSQKKIIIKLLNSLLISITNDYIVDNRVYLRFYGDKVLSNGMLRYTIRGT